MPKYLACAFASALSEVRRLEASQREENEECEKLTEEIEELTAKKENASAGNMDITLSMTNVRRDIDELNRRQESVNQDTARNTEEIASKKSDVENIIKTNEALEFTKSENNAPVCPVFTLEAILFHL